LHSAVLTRFTDALEYDENKFDMCDYVPSKPEAELVFFWHNGLAPVKNEWSINFVIDHRADNMVVFTNDNLGISFPFEVEEKKDKSSLSKLEVFRVAFPRYDERPLYYREASISVGDRTVPLELTEDVSKIAFHSLRQRMVLEFSKG